jgi:hypothetical protein
MSILALHANSSKERSKLLEKLRLAEGHIPCFPLSGRTGAALEASILKDRSSTLSTLRKKRRKFPKTCNVKSHNNIVEFSKTCKCKELASD